jgi:hypothetical protein
VVRVLHRYRCPTEWAWLRFHRAFTTLDMSLVYLYPDVNYSRMLQKYFLRAELRSLQQMLGARMTMRSIGAYRTTLDIQDRVNEYTMFQGQLMRREAQLFAGATNKFAAFLGSIVMTVALCVLVLEGLAVAVFLEQHHRAGIRAVVGDRAAEFAAQFPTLDYSAWVALLVFVAFVGFRLTRTSRVLRQKEVRQRQHVVAV